MQQIYRVGGFYASGVCHFHLVGATSARQAIESVKAADNRFVRITHCSIVHDEE
jgi:hypothetical protein